MIIFIISLIVLLLLLFLVILPLTIHWPFKLGGKEKFLENKYAVIGVWGGGKNGITAQTNLGDDIQTLAAIDYLKKKGIDNYNIIHREKLSDYDDEPVKLVMNGWFISDSNKFPPSNKITPLFISFHCRENLIKKYSSYFKKYEPIGCRDMLTKELFNKHNIKAYFTGCLTLNFDEVKKKSNKNYFVSDKSSYGPDIRNYRNNFKNFIKIEDHFIPTSHIAFNDINKRLELANNLLDKYRTANLVVTGRLHSILPCRAFNTNAIFIHKDYNTEHRFSGLKHIINGNTTLHNKDSIDRKLLFNIKNFFNEYRGKNWAFR